MGDNQLEIPQKDGVSPDQQRLVFAETQLEEGHILADYNIQEDGESHRALRLRVGMFHTS